MALVPNADQISVREVLAKFEAEFATVARAVENGEFALWVGSGISRNAPNLGKLIERALDFLRVRAIHTATADIYSSAFEEALRFANVEPADLSGQFERPLADWPERNAIIRELWNKYSRVLDIRIKDKPPDFILWEAVDIQAAFADPEPPVAEHLCIAILILEGAVGTIASANWDGFIEAAILRVRPETLCRITEFSEHESNGRELDEGERVAVEVLPVLGQSAAAVEPGDGAFDHPTPGLDDEALHPIGSLDDLGLEIGQDAGQGAVKDRALIGAVGEQFPEKGKQTEQGRQQRETAVAILNVGGGDDAVQQQALRIDQNMPLLALDQLAGIEAVAVDASPPFSALFTL